MPYNVGVPFAGQVLAGKVYSGGYDPVMASMQPLIEDAGTFPASHVKCQYIGGVSILKNIFGSPILTGSAVATAQAVQDGQTAIASGIKIRGAVPPGLAQFGLSLSSDAPIRACEPRVRAVFTSQDISDARVFVGFIGGGTYPIDSDTSSRNAVGVVYSPGVNGGNWRFYMGNGGAGTYENTVIPFAANTFYIIDVFFGPTYAKARINGIGYDYTGGMAAGPGAADALTPAAPRCETKVGTATEQNIIVHACYGTTR